MPLQYSDQEINDFVQVLQQGVREDLARTKSVIPLGFTLGKLDPSGSKRSVHVLYASTVRNYSRLKNLSWDIQRMALHTEAECAGCVVAMPVILQKGSHKPAHFRETVMIHIEQLLVGNRFWYAQVQVLDGELGVSAFEELTVWPHPNHLSFLPVEMYDEVTAQA